MANKETVQASRNGIGFFGLLTIVFITLKLVGVIEWSWVAVLSPVLVPLGIALLIVFGVVVAALVSTWKTHKRKG